MNSIEFYSPWIDFCSSGEKLNSDKFDPALIEFTTIPKKDILKKKLKWRISKNNIYFLF